MSGGSNEVMRVSFPRKYKTFFYLKWRVLVHYGVILYLRLLVKPIQSGLILDMFSSCSQVV